MSNILQIYIILICIIFIFESRCDEAKNQTIETETKEVLDSTKFPFVAYIMNKNGSLHCGGVVISAYFILTTADSLVWNHHGKIIKLLLTKYFVGAGVSMVEYSGGNAQERSMLNIYIYQGYKPREQQNNIGMVMVQEPFDIKSKTLVPVVLSSEKCDGVEPFKKNEMKCILLNWKPGPHNTRVLVELNVTMINTTVCQSLHGSTTLELNDKQHICTKNSREPHTACVRHGGGLLMCGTSQFKKLFGLLHSRYEDCDTNTYPDVYTTVLPYQEWIESEINITYLRKIREKVRANMATTHTLILTFVLLPILVAFIN